MFEPAALRPNNIGKFMNLNTKIKIFMIHVTILCISTRRNFKIGLVLLNMDFLAVLIIVAEQRSVPSEHEILFLAFILCLSLNSISMTFLLQLLEFPLSAQS